MTLVAPALVFASAVKSAVADAVNGCPPLSVSIFTMRLAYLGVTSS